MRVVRKIIVGVRDLRARRLPAVEKAAQLARAFKADIELFHAMPRAERAEQTRLKARLETIAAPLRENLIAVTTQIGVDSPAGEAIVRRAHRIDADLIVAECHAGERRGNPFLRLTDWDLLRYSPVPVLLVKTKLPYRKPCLLAAVDPAHAIAEPAKLDAEILCTADIFRKALQGTLHAVHAYVPMPNDATPSELLNPAATKILETRAREHARARMQPLLKHAQIARASRHLISEHPINGIPRLARTIHSDIVVMGALSRSGLRRIFIGNTAERMLDDLACDVLVVKPPGFRSSLLPNSRERNGDARAARRAA